MGRKRQGSDDVSETGVVVETAGPGTTLDLAQRMANGENLVGDSEEVTQHLPVKSAKTLTTPAPTAHINLAGKYIAQCGIVTDDGVNHKPGEELTLSDSDARHFLKLHAVKLVTEVPMGGPAMAVNLPAGINLGGNYEALVVLKHGENAETQPGEVIALSDSDARHFLRQRAVKPLL
jgi:hypothetical protein